MLYLFQVDPLCSSPLSYLSLDTSAYTATSRLTARMCFCVTFERHSAADSAEPVIIYYALSKDRRLLDEMLGRYSV
jgi:hypothetical protein